MEIYLTRDVFQENLNSRFWLREENGERGALDLVALKDGRVTPHQEQFSLLFRGDPGRIYPQQIFSLEHDSIGQLELFLVPVGRDVEGTMYEAVFNRMLNV
jgi:hypothetical protein